MLEVYFLRHGQTRFNAMGNRYCGRTDVELTELGISQARSVAAQVKDIRFDAIFASPLQRAYNTAQLASGNGTVIKEPRLIEVDFGQWEGLRRDEFIIKDPAAWENWDSDPGSFPAGRTGETAMEVIKRVDAFFTDALQQYPDGRIMVVAHNGVNRLYLAWKLGMPLKNYRQLVQDNSTITVFELDERTAVLTLKKLNGQR